MPLPLSCYLVDTFYMHILLSHASKKEAPSHNWKHSILLKQILHKILIFKVQQISQFLLLPFLKRVYRQQQYTEEVLQQQSFGIFSQHIYQLSSTNIIMMNLTSNFFGVKLYEVRCDLELKQILDVKDQQMEEVAVVLKANCCRQYLFYLI